MPMDEGNYTNIKKDTGTAGRPKAEEGKYKSIPAILPLAPGGVYAVKWEQREKWSQPVETPEVPYDPPLGAPNPENPLCYLDIRAGGYYLGRVVFELKADSHPVTSENFLKLCEYKCYAGTMFRVFPGNWIRGGDFSNLDEVIYEPSDPEFFDFATLLPNLVEGGQSIYVNEDGPYFADESFSISHSGPGVLTMYNPGAPNCNGSQFMITLPLMAPEALDGTHVAFGQVVEGWNILAALEQLGDARQEGDTFQRVTVEACGVLSAGKGGAGTTATARGLIVGGAVRSVAVGAAGWAGRASKRSRSSMRGVLRSGKGLGSVHDGVKRGLGTAVATRFAYA